MFTKSLFASKSGASKLDRAVIASVAAMLALNVFVLTQQVQDGPALATAPAAHAAIQA